MAADQGVDLSTVTGSGVGGRIRKQDVLDAAAKAKEAAAKPAEAPSQPAAAAAPKAPRRSRRPRARCAARPSR